MRRELKTVAIVFASIAFMACGGDGSGTEGGNNTGGGSGGGSGSGSGAGGQPATAPGYQCAGQDSGGALGSDSEITCFSGDQADLPAATVEHQLEEVEGVDTIHIRLTLDPNFVDNSYGVNAMWDGRKKGHSFMDLVKSDHAELLVRDGTGDVVMQFKMDYITEDPSAPSGYSSLGVTGGDGAMIIGNAEDIVDVQTSLDLNLNERGYSQYIVDSPPADDNCTSAEAPNWDYRVVYDVWIRAEAFAGAGYGESYIEWIHASPAKGSSDTVVVEPAPCPPEVCWPIEPGWETCEGGGGGGGGGGNGGPGGSGGPCVDANDCVGDDVCNNGTCTGPSCEVDTDCSGNEVCYPNGTCGGATCIETNDCYGDDVCNSGTCGGGSGGEGGACSDNGYCTGGAVCEDGVCTGGGGSSGGSGETPCQDASDCPGGEFCGVEGYCRVPLFPPVD